jgi:hypothetical protein
MLKGLSVQSRILLITRCAVVACGVLLMVDGHPPAKAQDTDRPRVVATETMISTMDSDQNNAIGKLQDFKKNQESWNAQTGKDVADALTLSRATDNKLSGGLGLITIFTLLGIGLQFNGKRKTNG